MNKFLVVIRTHYAGSGCSYMLTSQVIESDKSLQLLREQIAMSDCSVLVVQL